MPKISSPSSPNNMKHLMALVRCYFISLRKFHLKDETTQIYLPDLPPNLTRFQASSSLQTSFRDFKLRAATERSWRSEILISPAFKVVVVLQQVAPTSERSCSNTNLEGSLRRVLSMPRSEESFSADYEALAEAEAEAEENVYRGLPREVLETMSNYSPSAGSMPSNVDLWELYGITPPASPPSGLSSSFLMNEVNNQRAMVIQAQRDNELLCGQLLASEITNGELAYSVSSISTAHVLVCLERDNLRRFRMVSIFIIMVLIIMVLIGIMFILLA